MTKRTDGDNNRSVREGGREGGGEKRKHQTHDGGEGRVASSSPSPTEEVFFLWG